LWFVLTYNGLVRWRNIVKNAWHQIDVQLKRRYDLIPNLVECVRGYAAHEKEIFETVARARNAALSAKSVGDVAAAENLMASAMKSLLAVVENYPQLKADANFKSLMEELVSTENKVAFARQYYNDSVQHYNTRVQTIPTSIVAGMCRFAEAEYFEAAEFEKEVVKVKFS
jgi:LemA protein